MFFRILKKDLKRKKAMNFSIEDGGEGVSFNVFCPNVQPGIAIDYATGDNELDYR